MNRAQSRLPFRPFRLLVGALALGLIASLPMLAAGEAPKHERADQRSTRPTHPTTLPRQWSFRLDRDAVGRTQRWFAPDVARALSWQTIRVNEPWNAQLSSDYHGVAWYWARFQSPQLGEDERLWLKLGQVKGAASVYINAQKLTTPDGVANDRDRDHNQNQDQAERADPAASEEAPEMAKAPEAAGRPRRYDITSHVQPGDNHLVIRVASDRDGGGIVDPALRRQTAPNWLTNPGFADGLDAWRLFIYDSDQTITPAFAPGMYVGERSVRVNAEPGQLVILDQHVEQKLVKGKSYRISVRYRQQLNEPAGDDDVTPLRLMWMTYPKRGTRQAHDKLWVHGNRETTKHWDALTGIFEAQEHYTGFRVGVFINAAGVYHVDEMSVAPVREADDATD